MQPNCSVPLSRVRRWRCLPSTSNYLAATVVSVCTLLALPSTSSAGLWYGSYWGVDGVFTQTTSGSVTVPTGYWYGGYPYVWGGYNWGLYGPYGGWYYNSPYSYAWLGGWGGPSWYYGFTDLATYRWTSTRTLYKYSYYWDPGGTNNVTDITAYADPNGLEALADADTSLYSETSHAYSADGGNFVGSGEFSANTWVPADAADISAYLTSIGMGTSDINAVLASLTLSGPGTSYGFQTASFTVPEPATMMVLALGSFALLARRHRRTPNRP